MCAVNGVAFDVWENKHKNISSFSFLKQSFFFSLENTARFDDDEESSSDDESDDDDNDDDDNAIDEDGLPEVDTK